MMDLHVVIRRMAFYVYFIFTVPCITLLSLRIHGVFLCCSGGCAITVDENLLHGRSEHCETFDNEPLVASHNGVFVVAVMEVFAFC